MSKLFQCDSNSMHFHMIGKNKKDIEQRGIERGYQIENTKIDIGGDSPIFKIDS